MPVDRAPGAPDPSPGPRLQGHELVAHVFVAADGGPADLRHLRDLWHRCVAAFTLDVVVDPHPGDWPADAPVVDEGEALLAVRSGHGPGVHQVMARRVHDVLCLSLVLAPEPGGGWAALVAHWAQVQRPPTPGVLGTVLILQARPADPDAALDVDALAAVVAEDSGTDRARWRRGTLRAEPPLGPFAVWEAGDGAADQPAWDGRADRTLVVLAPADRDPELSAWTWNRGDARLTPLARYLLHAAKLRYELRVRATSPGRALRQAVEEVFQKVEPLVGAVRIGDDEARAAAGWSARLRRLEIRLHRARAWLQDLRITVQIAARNMARHARHDQAAGLFADDRAVAEWLDAQLEQDRSYLAGSLELARGLLDAVAPLLPPPSAREEEARAEEATAEQPAARVSDDGGVALTGAQKRLLIDALSAAYPSYDDLALMLDLRLERRLAMYTPPAALDLAVHRVISKAESQGWTAELVTGAALENPGNPQLRGLLDSGRLDEVVAVRAAVEDPTGPARDLLPQAGILRNGIAAELEQIVRVADAFQNVVPFAAKLLEAAGRVCWVQVVTESRRSSGTGFLVGPDLVLTNHHVLASVIDGSASPTAVRCVFDYHLRADGTTDHGIPVGLHTDWLVASSPPSPVDEQSDPPGPPAPDELDYALVRIAGAPGRARVLGGRTRGWLDLLDPLPEVETGTPLLIVQHPRGHPVKLAVDTDGVLEVNANRTRFRYGVNSEKGSSGSPCFTFDLELVGLHHSGTERALRRNEGIPIETIAAHLRANGHAGTLGG